MKYCVVATCWRPHAARGYCGVHYMRWYQGKKMDAPMPDDDRSIICDGKWPIPCYQAWPVSKFTWCEKCLNR